MLSTVVVLVIALSLTACAGSPVHTSSLPPEELTKLDNHTLCMGATPRERYSPHPNVINEVKRRNLDCSRIYTYVPQTFITTIRY